MCFQACSTASSTEDPPWAGPKTTQPLLLTPLSFRSNEYLKQTKAAALQRQKQLKIEKEVRSQMCRV